MLSLDLIPRLVPPAGKMLVERLEMPERYGSLWLPEGYRGSTRSAYARVIHRGRNPEFRPVRPGDLVMLGLNVNRGVEFGSGESARTIWLCSPADILCVVLGETDELPERSDLDPASNITTDIKERASTQDRRFDEADPRALR